MFRILLLTLGLVALPAAARTVDPNIAVEELLAADRAYAADAAIAADPATAIATMLDANAVMPVPGKGHAIGREAVLASFRDSPSFREGVASWTPVRGGISADGTQGFTFGFFSLTGGDPANRERKYLAYWVKRPAGWRVAAYRHQLRDAGAVSTGMLPPSLPAFSVTRSARIAVHQQSLSAAEKSFSDRAQLVGLKTAFEEYGRNDSMNMYNNAGFTIGSHAIAAGFSTEIPATIRWATERSIVASSGDLGVSIGTIWSNKPSADGKPPRSAPFFTVWRRERPGKPWYYIAE